MACFVSDPLLIARHWSQEAEEV